MLSQVWNRLYEESMTNQEVHVLWQQLKQKEEVEGCTFRPAVNHSVDVAALRPDAENVWDWLAKPKKKKEPYRDPNVTFKPSVNTSRTSVGGKGAKGKAAPPPAVASVGDGATAEAVYERLYANALRSGKLKREVLTRIKTQEELSGCTFKPQVRSALVPARDLRTLTYLDGCIAGESNKLVVNQRDGVPAAVSSCAIPGEDDC